MWREHAPRFDVSVSKPDVVILAGDIHTKSRAPAWAAEMFPDLPVIYVAGNHEFYAQTLEDTAPAIRSECARYSNVRYLDCDEYLLEGVRFLGATLWTDFSLFGADRKWGAMSSSREVMNDYRHVRVATAGYRKLNPQDTARMHASHRDWLRSRLEAPFTGRTIVVTHMAPSMRSVAPPYATDPVSAAFASNLEDMVAKADLWIHGHTHTSFDYQVGKCRVVANPLGYRLRDGSPENALFRHDFVVQTRDLDRDLST